MPTDYAPRQKKPPPRGGIGKQSLALRIFGAGALCGIALTLVFVYVPTLWSSDESPATDETDEAEVVAPALTYEFMDRLPNEEVVTNVTPYEPPAEDAATQEDEASPEPAAPSDMAQASAEPSKPKPPLLAAMPRVAPPKPAADETPPRQEEETPPQQEYVLRTPSFDSRDEADALRARLILEGLPVAVKVVGEPQGASHRVVVGPFPNQLAMRQTRSALRAEGIAGLSPDGVDG